MATHCSILPWRIPWTEEPGMLHSMGSQREGPDWVHTNMHEILSSLDQMRNTVKLWLGCGRFLFVIEEKAKGSQTVLHIINQLENYRRIITFSKHKDCSNSLFSCSSKQTLTQRSVCIRRWNILCWKKIILSISIFCCYRMLSYFLFLSSFLSSFLTSSLSLFLSFYCFSWLFSQTSSQAHLASMMKTDFFKTEMFHWAGYPDLW